MNMNCDKDIGFFEKSKYFSNRWSFSLMRTWLLELEIRNIRYLCIWLNQSNMFYE